MLSLHSAEYASLFHPTRASDSWTGFRGTPADALKAYLANAKILPDVFLCGPPLLLEAATQAAVAAGVSSERIFCESFA